jgi:hypothetical protein
MSLLCQGGLQQYIDPCTCTGDNSLSMSSVGATPGICQQKGQTSADSASNYLNAIGKWGTTVAAVFTCRPVQSTPGGLTVQPKGGSIGIFGGSSSGLINILVLLAIIFVIYMVLERS